MVDIVNLRLPRKAKKRAEAQRGAQAKRLKHGRTKADKRSAEMSEQRCNALLDGARLENVED